MYSNSPPSCLHDHIPSIQLLDQAAEHHCKHISHQDNHQFNTEHISLCHPSRSMSILTNFNFFYAHSNQNFLIQTLGFLGHAASWLPGTSLVLEMILSSSPSYLPSSTCDLLSPGECSYCYFYTYCNYVFAIQKKSKLSLINWSFVNMKVNWAISCVNASTEHNN